MLVFCLFSLGIHAQESPLWMRYNTISPDGKTIAFCYKGDIYTVPVSGGRAFQVTTNPSYDTHPVWSPDSKNIAFSSNREGSFDIYIVSKDGGIPRRLTTHSAHEYVETFKDNDHILYKACIQWDATHGQFPSNLYPQIYEISTKGGRPTLFSSHTMEEISVNKKGDYLLYTDKKGYEDTWRKHHKSSITRDIWLYNLKDKKSFKKITSFAGEDRNAVWSNNGDTFFYLNEQDGNSNIYKSSVSGQSQPEQITKLKKNPVRFLSIADNGTLCFSYSGEIYTLQEGQSPKKVDIQIVSDKLESDVITQYFNGGATNIAVRPDGKEIAFIVRGDVYVTSTDYETTKRITDTPEQERDLDFSPDGRTLIYSSERNGIWNIYKTEIVREEDKYFSYAKELKEEPLTQSKTASFQPKFSPDGKEVAFLEDRTTLRVLNLKDKKIRTVLDGKFNYSYSDGDQWYEWSPDSKWFLAKYIGIGGWNNTDVALVKADGSGEITNLTESGYTDGRAKWVLDGKAMIWSSDRAGYRSHGSWGAHGDMYIMFFDNEAYDKFRMNKEDLALTEEMEKEEKKKEEEQKKKEEEKNKKKKNDDKENKAAEKEEKSLVFDLDNRKDRIIRLTNHSSSLGDAVLTPSGDKLYYLTSFESGADLWVRDLKENSTRLLIKGTGWGALIPDKECKYLYMCSGGALKRIEIANNSTKNISFRAEFNYRPQSERNYIFNHIWQQVNDKFYDKNIHGIDWNGYKTEYLKYLPHISNNFDFAEMLSEMLGELNGSHTGARYGENMRYQTATFGAFFDPEYDGDGLKIKEIIKNSPFTRADSKVKEGMVIETIDGQPIKKCEDYYPLLNGKAGKKILLTIYDPSTKKHFEQQIKALYYNEQNDLLYNRWVEQRREMTNKLSNGRIGYVHIKAMNSESFREAYSEILGRCRNKEAVLVDTRNNGGGWLHDDLVTLLSGKEYQQFAPRGQYIGSDPFNKWNKPSAVLICENNYSNAHGFPYVYKTLGIGKLIDAPVPGTMTAVWWETQIDPSIVFGIPQVGVRDMKGNYLENQELKPDIEVYNTPYDLLQGRDEQLEKGVEHLLNVIGKK